MNVLNILQRDDAGRLVEQGSVALKVSIKWSVMGSSSDFLL